MFWGPGTYRRPNFDGFIYIHYAAPPYLPHISVIYLLPSGKSLVDFPLLTSVCNAYGNEALRRIYEGSVKLS